MDAILIGMGMVGQTHLMALRDNAAGIRLTGVLGRTAQRSAEYATKASDVLGYAVPALEGVAPADFAILITPPNARLGHVQALAAQATPCLMEKPIERSLKGAQSVVQAMGDVPAGLCFQMRTRAAVQALKSKLDSGDLGAIVHADIRVPWWRDQAYYDVPGRGSYDRDGGGVMINQAIHTLDLALWFCGRVDTVQAMMRTSPLHQMEAEDIAAALLQFANGATGVLSATTAAYPGGAESIALTTSKAQVHLQGDDLRIDWHDGSSDHLAAETQGTGGGADPMAFTHGWHQAVIEDFADVVRAGKTPIAPMADGLHVHAVISAMEAAAQSGHTQRVDP